jgi:hypothetical protein
MAYSLSLLVRLGVWAWLLLSQQVKPAIKAAVASAMPAGRRQNEGE